MSPLLRQCNHVCLQSPQLGKTAAPSGVLKEKAKSSADDSTSQEIADKDLVLSQATRKGCWEESPCGSEGRIG